MNYKIETDENNPLSFRTKSKELIEGWESLVRMRMGHALSTSWMLGRLSCSA